ncbi:ubiquitin-like protein ISG15 [Molossus molossus]|uniref:ISG15 ubiquitin like modifier n=1 Tax=Molossus molossus TaxID=27622 RepID=A0A7J8B8U9_MOLMO|nr:ubiquitin-like protein ISG15 [Molossus molossus]KAF6394886.1 ISG15 ubiquitin like modifier [Molossus molossus]
MNGYVKVKMLSKEFQVPLSASMMLSDLKQQITQKTQVPAFQQRLVIESSSTELLDGVSLHRQGLSPGSTVILVVQRCDKPLSILVRNDRARTRPYEVLLTQKVAELKQQVSKQEGAPTNQFWLSFQGRAMDDHQQLGEYNLQPNCIVQMNLHLRGGGEGPRGPH